MRNQLFAIARDLQVGLRQLRRSPITSITVVLTLAFAIAATTAMLSMVNAWLIRPLPLKDPQQLVSIWRTAQSSPREPAFFNLYHDYLVWAQQNRSFESLAATFEQEYALTGAGEPEELHGAVATWNLFSTVGASAAAGRLFVADDVNGEPACVISHSLWRAHFGGSPDVIGRGIALNGKLYRVLGILPAGFSLRVLDRPFETAVWTLITANDPGHNASSPAPVALIGRLKRGVTSAQAQADLGAMQGELSRRFKGYPPGVGILVIGLQQDNTRTVRASLLSLVGAVALLLLIACVNAGSLIVGSNSQRAGEFAVRVALGCSPARLLQQVTLEILALFLIAGTAGVALAFVLLRIFTAQNPLGVLPPGGLSVDGKIIALTSALVCASALIFGSLPAFRALRSRNANSDALRLRSGTADRKHLRSRMLFVAVEFALSVVLLVGAGLLISTFVHIDSEDPGFSTSGVLVATVSVPYRNYPTVADQARLTDTILHNLSAAAKIKHAGAALAWPFEINGLNPIETEGKTFASTPQMSTAAFLRAGPGYFEALGVPVLRGRTFTPNDRPNAPDVAVVNEEFARQFFGAQDPVGKHVRIRYPGEQQPTEPWVTIVGVVGATRSIRYDQIQWDRYPAIYTSMFQQQETGKMRRFDAEPFYFYVQGAADSRVISAAVHAADPTLPVGEVRTTGQIVNELRSQPRLRARTLGAFAAFTLLLAAIGIYGVMVQFVEQRRREIGIRVALGALQQNIVRLILRRALLLTGFGIIAGVAATAALTRVLRSLLYNVSPLDPVIFAATIGILTAVAILASYLPARRALKIEPTEALRAE